MLSRRCATSQPRTTVATGGRLLRSPLRLAPVAAALRDSSGVSSSASASTSSSPIQSLTSRVVNAGAAAALAIALIGAPVQPAFANSPLVDSMRAEFKFVDTDKNGYVTLTELEQLAAMMAEDKGYDLPSDQQLQFTLGLFDLDQDGQLTSKEMINSLGLTLLDEDEVEPEKEEGFFVTGDWWACYLFPC